MLSADARIRLARPAMLVAGLALITGGCSLVPERHEFEAGSAAPSTIGAGTALQDGRAGFRQVFCDLARQDGHVPSADPDCRTLLWRLSDEPGPDRPGRPAGRSAGLRWFVVSGALGGCFGEDSLPFRSGIERLARSGTRIETITVSGRSGVEHNAREIADALENAGLGPSERVALVGYSKGALDILRFLVDYPAEAARVDAVVSVSGPIAGSPLAASGDWLYDHLLVHAFEDRCDPGDGRVVDSLVPEVRWQWLAEHTLPAHVEYFSLAAFTTREHLASGLWATWELLAGADKRNDGQVIIGDAMIPGSTLLGYANTDHWGIALTVENVLPHIAGRSDPRPFPQDPLIAAITRYVEETLAGGPAP